MDQFSQHYFRTGQHEEGFKDEDSAVSPKAYRKQIEPWLTAVFQSEHLSLLLGSGFTTGLVIAGKGKPADMAQCQWDEKLEARALVDQYAKASASTCGRGNPNIEDQFRAALQLTAGLEVLGDESAKRWKLEIDQKLKTFMDTVLSSERSFRDCDPTLKKDAENLLISFLLSFASRAATRERLNLFTTNYDRFIEYGCDLSGLHVIDRFVGSLSPIFRTSRLSIDLHYNPPGIRGEPRYLEGVVRLSKLHGSLDWRWEEGEIRRVDLPFGATDAHPAIPESATDSVMIYPNPAKDVETIAYPYAELFRDFAASICRPNSSIVTYGYGFGDDHINRVLRDMLTIPSTHLVIIAYDRFNPDNTNGNHKDEEKAKRKRILDFCDRVGRKAQISLLLGSHFGDLNTLIENYLPKPAIDTITFREAKLKADRGDIFRVDGGEDHEDPTD